MVDALTGELRDPALERRYLEETTPTLWWRSATAVAALAGVWAILTLDDPFIDGAYTPVITVLRLVGLGIIGGAVWFGGRGGWAELRGAGIALVMGIDACWMGIALLNEVVDNHRPLQVALFLFGIGLSNVFSGPQLAGLAVAVAVPQYVFHLWVGGSHPLLTGVWLFVAACLTLGFHRQAGTADRLEHLARWRLADMVTQREHLVAAVGHELRAPLATMRVITSLVREASPERREEWLDRMNERIEALDASLLAVMRLGALSSDEPVKRIRPVQVAGLWAAITEELDAMRREGFEVEHDDVVATVHVDPDLIGVALRNLLTNALRYGRSRACTRTRVDDEGQVHFEIHDDGPGIPAEQRATVFEPLVRASSSRAVDEKGVGLGLAVVLRVARAHGGEVVVGDSPLGGAWFDLSIPARPSALPPRA